MNPFWWWRRLLWWRKAPQIDPRTLPQSPAARLAFLQACLDQLLVREKDVPRLLTYVPEENRAGLRN